MENASNALIMAGAILIFVIAISIGVMMYTRVLDVNDMILTNSEHYNRTAESLSENYDIERPIPGSEVVNQILEIAKASNNSQGSDFHYNSITVEGIGLNEAYKVFSEENLKNKHGIKVDDAFGKIIVESNGHSSFIASLNAILGHDYRASIPNFSTAADGSSIVAITYTKI